MRRLVICLLVLGLSSPAVAQEDPYTVQFVLPGCRYLLDMNDPALEKYAAIGGVCAGVIETLVTINPSLEPEYRICRPVGRTLRHDIKTVVKYLQADPTIWHQKFVPAAHLALKQAWPCR